MSGGISRSSIVRTIGSLAFFFSSRVSSLRRSSSASLMDGLLSGPLRDSIFFGDHPAVRFEIPPRRKKRVVLVHAPAFSATARTSDDVLVPVQRSPVLAQHPHGLRSATQSAGPGRVFLFLRLKGVFDIRTPSRRAETRSPRTSEFQATDKRLRTSPASHGSRCGIEFGFCETWLRFLAYPSSFSLRDTTGKLVCGFRRTESGN